MGEFRKKLLEKVGYFIWRVRKIVGKIAPFENVGKIVRILSEKFENSWNKSRKLLETLKGN